MIAARLVELLGAARRRGDDFEDAWPAATLCAVRDAPEWQREQWLTAFNATRDAWRAGYDRQHAPRRERAVLALLDPDEREPVVDADRAAA
jgi:hypothetical protein